MKKTELVRQLYNNQKGSSKRRGHNPPLYSKSELKDWLYSQSTFHKLYNNWKNLGFISNFKPSIDRLDDNIGYLFENISITTWKKNIDKSYQDRKNGKLITSQNKLTVQLTLDGKIINTFCSVKEAGRKTGIDRTNIGACCRNKRKTAGGHKWRFSNEERN